MTCSLLHQLVGNVGVPDSVVFLNLDGLDDESVKNIQGVFDLLLVKAKERFSEESFDDWCSKYSSALSPHEDAFDWTQKNILRFLHAEMLSELKQRELELFRNNQVLLKEDDVWGDEMYENVAMLKVLSRTSYELSCQIGVEFN